jgi:hypothetical protein
LTISIQRSSVCEYDSSLETNPGCCCAHLDVTSTVARNRSRDTPGFRLKRTTSTTLGLGCDGIRGVPTANGMSIR